MWQVQVPGTPGAKVTFTYCCFSKIVGGRFFCRLSNSFRVGLLHVLEALHNLFVQDCQTSTCQIVGPGVILLVAAVPLLLFLLLNGMWAVGYS